MKINNLYENIKRVWSKETCVSGLQEFWSETNPSLGQCAITVLIVNDIFGGKIMRCMVGGVSHYYNIVDGKLLDFTAEQFGLNNVPDYSKGEERTREYLLGNEETKKRYLLLLSKVKEDIIKRKSVENIDYNIFEDVENIIVDIDGTLIDSIGLWNDVDEKIISGFGKTPRNVGLDRDRFLAENTYGDIFVNYAQYVIDSYGITGITAKELFDMRCDIAEVYHTEKLQLKEGADEFLIKARELGYILTLATITIPRFLDIYAYKNKNICSKIKLYEIFNGGVLTKENVSHKKPNPEVYFKAVEIGGCPSESCIVIEDSLSGIQAAKGAGLKTISIYDKYADCDREEIDELTDYTTPGFRALKRNIIL